MSNYLQTRYDVPANYPPLLEDEEEFLCYLSECGNEHAMWDEWSSSTEEVTTPEDVAAGRRVWLSTVRAEVGMGCRPIPSDAERGWNDVYEDDEDDED